MLMQPFRADLAGIVSNIARHGCRLLGTHLPIRLDCDMLVGLKSLDSIFGELGSEALDQSEFIGDLAAFVGDGLLGLLELFGAGTRVQSDVVGRHVELVVLVCEMCEY